MDRASRFGREGWEFDSPRARKIPLDIIQKKYYVLSMGKIEAGGLASFVTEHDGRDWEPFIITTEAELFADPNREDPKDLNSDGHRVVDEGVFMRVTASTNPTLIVSFTAPERDVPAIVRKGSVGVIREALGGQPISVIVTDPIFT